MSTWATIRVKDEMDILPATLKRIAYHVDAILVEDNGSTDGTLEFLREQEAGDLRAKLLVQEEHTVAYYQSAHMSRLAEQARQLGATWIIPADADEVWLGRRNKSERVADILAALDPCVLVAEAWLFDHVVCREDSNVGDVVERTPFRRNAPAPLRKVAFRAVEGAIVRQGNHSVEFPGVLYPPAVTEALQVRHYPYRSVEQFVSKVRNGAAAYAAAVDLPRDMGGHWRSYGQILESRGVSGISEIFHKWFYSLDPAADGLVRDAV